MAQFVGIAALKISLVTVRCNNFLDPLGRQRLPVPLEPEVFGTEGLRPVLQLVFHEGLGHPATEGNEAFFLALAHHPQQVLLEVDIACP